MKKITIVLLYNTRRVYPDPDDPRTQHEVDFDDPETTRIQIEYLKKMGYDVLPIEADERAYEKLRKNKNKIDLVFNNSEGLHGLDREAQMPAILEVLQIPYTGSSPLTQALLLHKAKAKDILTAHGIPTLPYLLFNYHKEVTLPVSLDFPYIVKPVSEGSSAGITGKSIVHTKEELTKQIKTIHKNFHEGALVEKFLAGREFSVSMIGNPPKLMPIVEADHSKLPRKYGGFDSLEVKWYYEFESKENHLVCPANISKKLRKKIEDICYKAWDTLNIRDWCRIDIRCDEKENPYFLEANSPPGCTPPEHDIASYLPFAARAAGLQYEDLLRLIFNTALKRYKKA